MFSTDCCCGNHLVFHVLARCAHDSAEELIVALDEIVSGPDGFVRGQPLGPKERAKRLLVKGLRCAKAVEPRRQRNTAEKRHGGVINRSAAAAVTAVTAAAAAAAVAAAFAADGVAAAAATVAACICMHVLNMTYVDMHHSGRRTETWNTGQK